MKSLLVDTSTSKLLIYIVENNSVLFSFNEKLDKTLSSRFMLIIENAFKQTNISPKEIDKIFVSIGPGSFTGIRIGMTFAKIYSLLLKKDLIPISTLELFASSLNEGECYALIDARRGYVYSGFYNSNLDTVIKEKYVLLDDLLKDVCQKCKIYSYDSFSNINVIEPKINVLKVINKHINDIPINPHSLKPLYLKNTEAEDKLNEF